MFNGVPGWFATHGAVVRQVQKPESERSKSNNNEFEVNISKSSSLTSFHAANLAKGLLVFVQGQTTRLPKLSIASRSQVTAKNGHQKGCKKKSPKTSKKTQNSSTKSSPQHFFPRIKVFHFSLAVRLQQLSVMASHLCIKFPAMAGWFGLTKDWARCEITRHCKPQTTLAIPVWHWCRTLGKLFTWSLLFTYLYSWHLLTFCFSFCFTWSLFIFCSQLPKP